MQRAFAQHTLEEFGMLVRLADWCYRKRWATATGVAAGLADRLLPNIHVEGHEITDEEFTLRDTIVSQRTSSGLRAGSEV
jgi:hypothetical protein